AGHRPAGRADPGPDPALVPGGPVRRPPGAPTAPGGGPARGRAGLAAGRAHPRRGRRVGRPGDGAHRPLLGAGGARAAGREHPRRRPGCRRAVRPGLARAPPLRAALLVGLPGAADRPAHRARHRAHRAGPHRGLAVLAGALLGQLADAPDTGVIAGQAAATVLWLVIAAALIQHGLRHASVGRTAGLALAALGVAKLLIFDLAFLDGIARVLSFI